MIFLKKIALCVGMLEVKPCTEPSKRALDQYSFLTTSTILKAVIILLTTITLTKSRIKLVSNKLVEESFRNLCLIVMVIIIRNAF